MDETGDWSLGNAAGKIISAAFTWEAAFKLQVPATESRSEANHGHAIMDTVNKADNFLFFTAGEGGGINFSEASFAISCEVK